jgi:small nuclear ribonucleoprotein (snRNP)-like protein
MMQKRNTLLAMALLAMIAVTGSLCQGKSTISTKVVDVKNFLDLSRFKDILKSGTVISGSSIAMDARGNIYLLDIKNHRILIINDKGREVGQIGRIGQDDQSLFNPSGVAIDNDKIYVLNNRGEKIKVFTLGNRFLWSAKIDDNWMPGTIVAKDGRYYIGERTKNAKSYNQRQLISIRDKNGKLVKAVGRAIRCKSYLVYLDLNSVYFQVVNNRIFGAHRYYPVCFAYDLDGRELFYKHLSAFLPEFKELNERAEREGFDTPKTIKKEDDNSIRSLIYCRGFGVNHKQDIYYAIQNFDPKREPDQRYFVIRLNDSGNIIEKIIYKKKGQPLRIGTIIADPANKLYAIGFEDKNIGFKDENIMLFAL